MDRTEASEHAHAWRWGRDLIAGAADKRNGIGKGRISLSGDFGQVQVLAAEKRKKVIERLCCVLLKALLVFVILGIAPGSRMAIHP